MHGCREGAKWRISNLEKRLAAANKKAGSGGGRSGIEIGANKENLYVVTPDEQVWRRPAAAPADGKRVKLARINPGQISSVFVGAKSLWGCNKAGAVLFCPDANAPEDKLDWKTVELLDQHATQVVASPEYVYITNKADEIYRVKIDANGKVEGGKVEGDRVIMPPPKEAEKENGAQQGQWEKMTGWPILPTFQVRVSDVINTLKLAPWVEDLYPNVWNLGQRHLRRPSIRD